MKYAKVKSAEFTSKKIAGLDIRSRESYLALLENVLRTNYEKFSQFGTGAETQKKVKMTSTTRLKKISICLRFHHYKCGYSNYQTNALISDDGAYYK